MNGASLLPQHQTCVQALLNSLMIPFEQVSTEKVGQENIDDAVGEFANMAAGSPRSFALDTQGEFQLGLPSKMESWERDSPPLGRRLSSGAISIELVIGNRRGGKA
ncbi:MAG: hypothetical protein ACI8TQ_000606 [Planctomycetota bacterium]